MRQEYLNSIKAGAIDGWYKYKITPSLTAAQAALESGWGTSKLAAPPYNNNFGIKAGADWTGRTASMSTQEWNGSKFITIVDTFRAYDSINDSVEDHGAFFTSSAWRINNYRNVIGEGDYKKACYAVANAGYATDPNYATKLINIIETYNLQAWDIEAQNGNPNNATMENTKTSKIVGGAISSAASKTVSSLLLSVIGDSLGVGTEKFLKKYSWAKAYYDNIGSRQWTHATASLDATQALQTMLNNGNLQKNVVFILGTNRGVTIAEIDNVVSICGRDRNIILVDTASEVNHKNAVSNAYNEASKRHPNVYYANWSDYARANIGTWYNADGANGTRIHMKDIGYQKHAEFIIQAVYEASNTNWVEEISTPTEKSTERINIYDVEYNDGKYTSPKGDSSIYNKELNDQLGFRPKKAQIMWIERKYTGEEDNAADLLEAALKKMDEYSVPAAQYTVPMRYFPSDVAIGDTGYFIDHEFNPPLYIYARVLSMTTSESNPGNDSVVIGNVIEVHPKDKADILALQKQLQENRKDALAEFWKEKPITLEILTSNGVNLSANQGDIYNELVKQTTGGIEVKNGSVDIPLHNGKAVGNMISITGNIRDNYIDIVDEIAGEINAPIPEETFTGPVDPNSNPQGPTVTDITASLDVRQLIVNQFEVQLLDAAGNSMRSTTLNVYEDSTFALKVDDLPNHINKIRILSNQNFILDDVSALDVSDTTSDYVDKTRLYVKAYQEDAEVTHRFKNFSWSRISANKRLDEEWNDAHKFNETNGIDLTPSDVFSNESTFVCKMYDDNFEFVAATSTTLKLALDGKSAYELAVENGFEGNLIDWIDSLQGADGAVGVPGEKGEDGRAGYTHIAYANNQDGTLDFSTTDHTNKRYFGMYVDFIAADSQDPSKYKWMLFKGNDGKTPIKGVDYFDGQDGQDGISNFIHIMYSNNANGMPMTDIPSRYIGINVSNNSVQPNDPSAYNWQLLEGSDGIPGEPGEDGKTSYIHIKYSNDNGTSFTANNGETVGTYMGVYTDFTKEDSLNPQDYTWSRTRGDTGPQGDPGPQGVAGVKGADGKTTYTWIKYADDKNGNGISNDPEGKMYMGLAYNKDSATESNNSLDYTWSLIKGEKGDTGVQGVKGVDGVTTYTWIKYSADANGSGMTDVPNTNTKYIGIAVNKTTAAESTTASDYTWSLFKGDKGDQGDPGENATARNFLLDSKPSSPITNSSYPIASFLLAEKPVVGETYTITIKGQLAATKTAFFAYNSGGSISVASNIVHQGNGLYYKSFNWINSYSSGVTANDTSVVIYPFTSSQTGTSTIEWVSLVKGSVPLTEWVPAHEDLALDVNKKTYNPVRYIRDWSNGSTANTGNHWYELMAIDEYGNNRALGGTVTSNGTGSNFHHLTNGVTATGTYVSAVNNGDPLYVQVDLGKVYYNITEIKVWKYYNDGRTYYENKTEVSSDGTTWYPIYDYTVEGEYTPTEQGKSIPNTIAKTHSILTGSGTKNIIDGKADGSATEAALNEAASKLQVLQQEIEAAATSNELKDFIDKYNKDMASRDKDARESESSLSDALASISSIQTNMGDMSATWQFIDRFIKNTPQGIVVGNDSSGSYILIKEDRLSFYSNGQEVAFISQNLMEISRGAFVEQIQIAKYQFEESTTNHLTIRYVG